MEFCALTLFFPIMLLNQSMTLYAINSIGNETCHWRAHDVTRMDGFYDVLEDKIYLRVQPWEIKKMMRAAAHEKCHRLIHTGQLYFGGRHSTQEEEKFCWQYADQVIN